MNKRPLFLAAAFFLLGILAARLGNVWIFLLSAIFLACHSYLRWKKRGGVQGIVYAVSYTHLGAKSKEEAKILSKSVVCSSLTKAAIYGHDANWGRILCALGYSGVEFDPEKVDLVFESAAGSIQIIKNGIAVDYSEEEATRILSEPAVTAIANMNQGNAEATAWGCDLTYDYVKINADYRS